MIKYKEQHTRSIVKTLSWRIVLTMSHIINAYIVTGSFITGLQIAGMAAIVNTMLFWFHERIWNIFQWNRKKSDTITYSEGQFRTIGKMVTWRILITFSNFLIPFILTGSWGSALLFVGLATLVNIAIYWAHERIWNRIKWGKKTQLIEQV